MVGVIAESIINKNVYHINNNVYNYPLYIVLEWTLYMVDTLMLSSVTGDIKQRHAPEMAAPQGEHHDDKPNNSKSPKRRSCRS